MRIVAIVAALFAFTSPAFAQEPAHSTNEHLGTVVFSTTCSAEVAPQFNRAVAWLHSFEFASSIRNFEQVAQSDSTCAMAYWGIALSRWGNPTAVGNRAAGQIEKGRAALDAAARVSGKASSREQAYIDAVGNLYENAESVNQTDRVASYAHAMAELAAHYPDDTEAQIFYAISLAAAASPTDKTYANQRKAGAILEALFQKYPNHPGLAHYIIHAYDVPALAPEAARAARTYAAIAPSAAHAMHMPSHIFTRVGQWNESIETNLHSIRIAETSGSIAEMLHAMDYAVYAYLQERRDPEAKALVDRLPDLAKKFDVNAVTGAAPGSAGVFALAAIPARYALEREAWADAAALEPAHTDFAWTDAMTYFARALGASRSGNLPVARSSIDSLAVIRDRLAAHSESYWSEQVAIQYIGAKAWLDLAEGRSDSALAGMRQAVLREDATEKNSVTPGPLAPAGELLGDMLIQLKRPKEALAEYQRTLTKEPNRYRSLNGALHAATTIGDKSVEREMRRKLQSLRGA